MGRLLLLIALLASSCGMAFAQQTPPPSAEIAPSGKLRVGMIAIAALGGVAEPMAKLIGQQRGVATEPVMYQSPEAYVQSFGKGEWDIAIGPRELAPPDKADFTPDIWLVSLVCVAAPEKQFADIGAIDSKGVTIGTIRGAPSDRVLSSAIKAADIVRIPLSPTIAADAAKLLRARKADLFCADSGVGYPAAAAVPGAGIVPGAFGMVHVAAALPKGRSAAAQEALAKIVNDAKRTDDVLQKAIDAKGLKDVFPVYTYSPPPDRLVISDDDGDDEAKIDTSLQACVANVKSETGGWSDEDIAAAAQKQCAARKRHLAAYQALQGYYRTLMGLLGADVRLQPAKAAEDLKAVLKACKDHKQDVSTGGHNIMVDVIEDDVAAKCLALGANLLREEIRERRSGQCVPGVQWSC